MRAQPLSSEVRGGVLCITLDTPACPVNIFSHQAALLLLASLDEIDDGVRAVVLQSGKPGSFVNGVGLMLASAVARPDDVPRLTATIRQAYQALGDLKIPTIAAIRGNCYGCGVELIAKCRYRVAADGYDTHFYMTELADYLFVPTFGGTQVLPRLLGLENATDFVLWGQRWSASDALARGLLHGVYSDDTFDEVVERIATDLGRHGASDLLPPQATAPPTDVTAVGRRTRERIRRLPPAYRDVYSSCYELMEQASLKGTSDSADYNAEMLAAGRSVMTPTSKAALSFFFVRQLCEQTCLRGASEQTAFRVRCEPSDGAPRFFRKELERRRIRGVTFEGVSEPPVSTASLHILAYGSPPREPTRKDSIAMSDVLELTAPVWQTDMVVYAPSWRHGIPFVEVACSRPSDGARSVFALLTKAGLTGAITQPKRTFVTNDLLCSYLLPQVAFLRAGGAERDLAMTLLDFGFTRLAGDWLRGWDREKLATLVNGGPDAGEGAWKVCFEAIGALPRAADFEGGHRSAPLEGAVLASLLAFARRNLGDGSASHPSIVDVAAREILDFPLGRASLCRHVTVARAQELLRGERALAPLVPEQTVASLKEYVNHGRDFYR